MIVFAAQPADPADTLLMLGVIVIGVCVVMFMQMMAMAKFYRKALPDQAIVRTGHGGLRVAVGSGLFVIPVLHQFGYLSLAVSRIDLTGTQLDSEQAQSLQLPNVFQISIGREREMIRCAAQRLGSSGVGNLLVEDIIFDEFERLLAQANDNSSQDSPANRFIEGIEQALNAVGLTIIACRRQ